MSTPENLSLLLSAHPSSKSLSVECARNAYALLTKVLPQESNDTEQVHFCHLDSIGFSPILAQDEIDRRASFDALCLEHQSLIKNATILALFFPDWWGLPPALLVGWLQRVFAPGVAFQYEGEEFMPKKSKPLLSHLRVVLSITSNETDLAKVEQSCTLLKDRVFTPVGIQHTEYNILLDTHHSTIHQRNQWMKKSAELIQKIR